MSSLKLALQYMEIFFSGQNLEDLRSLFTEDFSFAGPFFTFDSADDYIRSLLDAPPDKFEYEILNSFEQDSSVCLIYQFRKPGITTAMAQVFEIRDERINKILLVFDTAVFN